tara:strand:- start:35 stop:961 length:927 start_codon:yes stop_codon:yes gene_type:complete
MASSYTANLGIEKPGSGEQAGTWGTTTNTNFDIIDRAINGVLSLSLTGTSTTLPTTDGSLSNGGHKVLLLGGSPSGTNTIVIGESTTEGNDQDKVYLVKNSSGQTAIFQQGDGSGGTASILNGETAWIFADGAGTGAQVQKASFDTVNDTTPQLGGVLDTNGNNIEFPDSSGAEVNRLKFGAGDDLQLYHDGSNSYVEDAGTGLLVVKGSQININSSGDESMAAFITDGAAILYHNNAEKITTTSAGVDVTGTVQGDSFTLDNGSNDWTVTVSSNKLRFNYAGTAKMELDTSGNLKVTGDVTAFGTIS